MSDTAINNLLTAELLANIGRSADPVEELVSRRDIRKYAVATGQGLKKFLDGDVAPPMFHIALFWDIVELDQLTADGISIDTLVPELPLARAMAGGLKIDYHKPIHPGDVLTATRTLTDMYEKQGSQGPLIFYEITTQVKDQAGDPVLTDITTRIMR